MTGDPKLIQRLNELLGRELGRNPFSKPVFRWDWSDELFWPAFRTGKMIPSEEILEVPVLDGSGRTESIRLSTLKPEYKADRQTLRASTWFITKWLSAEDLIHGGTQGHGRGYLGGVGPSQETLLSLWEKQFPGADFPHRGWRIPTDAFLPRSPEDPSVPNEPDTLHFIRCVKEQTSMSQEARLADMLAQEDWKSAQVDSRIGDEIRDSFPAFLNPKPGAKGNFVSFPSKGVILSS